MAGTSLSSHLLTAECGNRPQSPGIHLLRPLLPQSQKVDLHRSWTPAEWHNPSPVMCTTYRRDETVFHTTENAFRIQMGTAPGNPHSDLIWRKAAQYHLHQRSLTSSAIFLIARATLPRKPFTSTLAISSKFARVLSLCVSTSSTSLPAASAPNCSNSSNVGIVGQLALKLLLWITKPIIITFWEGERERAGV